MVYLMTQSTYFIYGYLALDASYMYWEPNPKLVCMIIPWGGYDMQSN